ncbi:hypothetical protein Zmor_018383 [Zophobas morio]|uniref:Reverse transcriptase domain-containing protein n=1 Tax=Zophobas morio TaxID=2755281 RepID=A0AA38MCZ9_9CUCU|nr:hypothetical protein Zmor_018383 [Zophobas morio]
MSISNADILSAVKKTKPNKVCGSDNIPAFIIRDCITSFLSPLCHIYNLIILTSTFPKVWKTSRIIPVFKFDNRSHIHNYRPIALLSNYSKIFECIVSKAMYAHMLPMINVNQHGFVQGRSTTTNLMEFTQFVSSALDNRQQVDAVYTDLTKAFDTVHHCILLKKLKQYGFCDAMGDLMKSFMFSRYQFVECSGSKSDLFHAKSGVTQGSTLGPLLFLIYYNDDILQRCC